MKKRAIVFLAGEFEKLPPNFEFRCDDLIIAADGGFKNLVDLQIKPDFLVGDFDSLDQSLLKIAKDWQVVIENWPEQKDLTDAEIALDLALKEGCQSLLFLGAWGGNRPDHSLGNLALLHRLLEINIDALIYADGFFLRLCGPGNYRILGKGIVSLIPLTSVVTNIKTEGLFYPLEQENLYIGASRGLSNQFLEEQAQISFETGLLLLIWQGLLPKDF